MPDKALKDIKYKIVDGFVGPNKHIVTPEYPEPEDSIKVRTEMY